LLRIKVRPGLAWLVAGVINLRVITDHWPEFSICKYLIKGGFRTVAKGIYLGFCKRLIAHRFQKAINKVSSLFIKKSATPLFVALARGHIA
jgi:hypothetical protein